MYSNFHKFKNVLLFIIIIFYLQSYSYISVYGEDSIKSTIYVDLYDKGNYTTIQDAIDQTKSGDMVFIRNGTYNENLVIDKSIILIGENNTNTIINGRSAGNVIKINSNNVIIQNITIQHSGIYFPNSGINISSKHNTIKFNIIKNNLYGITLYNALNNTIQNNIIKENKNCGIYLRNSSSNYIINNIITDHDFNGIGIYNQSNNNYIINNNVMDNGYCGINIKISSMNEIIFNNITNNYIGIKNSSSLNTIIENNISNNNIDIEEDILTPGFKIVLFFTSIIIIYFITYYKKYVIQK